MAKIHPKGIHGGDQYNTTLHSSNPAISFPTKQTAMVKGSQLKAAKPHGGDQYGTTIQKSQPMLGLPNAKVALKNTSVGTHGTAMKIDSEKVVSSVSGSGMKIKSQNTRDSGNTCGLGVQQKVHYPKSGQRGQATHKVF